VSARPFLRRRAWQVARNPAPVYIPTRQQDIRVPLGKKNPHDPALLLKKINLTLHVDRKNLRNSGLPATNEKETTSLWSMLF
jgi:hypothetical protein